MKRIPFTFATHNAGYNNTRRKIILVGSNRKKYRAVVSRLQQCVKKLLRGSSFSRAGAAACLAIVLGVPAMAQQPQCNTFQNADAANPITKLLRPHEFISGLDFVDIDADGDLDCYAKVWNPTEGYYALPVLFRNQGTATQPVFVRDSQSGFAANTPETFSYSDIQFADLDGDGDFDCFIAESYPIGGSFDGTRIQYYENQGTAQQPVFVLNNAKNPIRFAYSFYGIGFTLADIDNDGDLDLVFSPDYGSYDETIYFNVGSATHPDFEFGGQDNVYAPTHRIYYDWNKDGLTDYFNDGAYYRNTGPKGSLQYVADSTGPQFGNGAPYRFVDLNNDGAAEVFNFNGGYSTLAPVAAIKAKPGQTGSFSYALLTSVNQSPGYKYQWKLNGADIPKATRASYPAIRKGSYTLAVTGTCGTGISLPYQLITSAGEQSSDALIANALPGIHSPVLMQASPNPFTNAVTLHIAQPVNGSSTIRVCDLQGRVLLTKQTSDAVTTAGENLTRGMYVVQVWQSNRLVFSQKIIKE